MNCAPIQVTGGSKDKSYYDSLPNMFVANVAVPGSEGQCQTVETKDTEIPNPGQFIIKDASAAPGPATGAGCAAAATAQLKGVKNYQSSTVSNFAAYTHPASDANQVIPIKSSGGSASASGFGGGAAATSSSQNNGMYTQAPAISASAAPTSSASAQPPASYGSASSAGPSATASATDAPSSFITMVTSGTAPTASVYPTMTLSAGAGISGPASGSPAAAPTGYSSSSGSGSSSGAQSGSSSSSPGNSTSTCSDNGSIVCNGPTTFGLCDNGSIVWQPVAPGTTCSNGAIQKRQDEAANNSAPVRRHIRGSSAARQQQGA